MYSNLSLWKFLAPLISKALTWLTKGCCLCLPQRCPKLADLLIPLLIHFWYFGKDWCGPSSYRDRCYPMSAILTCLLAISTFVGSASARISPNFLSSGMEFAKSGIWSILEAAHLFYWPCLAIYQISPPSIALLRYQVDLVPLLGLVEVCVATFLLLLVW